MKHRYVPMDVSSAETEDKQKFSKLHLRDTKKCDTKCFHCASSADSNLLKVFSLGDWIFVLILEILKPPCWTGRARMSWFTR